MRWQITWAGGVYDTDTLIVGELAIIERAAGVGWAGVSPYASTACLLALLGVFLCRDHDEDEVVRLVAKATEATVAELREAITEVS